MSSSLTVVRLFCLVLTLVSHGVQVVHGYDKLTCEPGPHEIPNVSPAHNSSAPDRFYVEWSTTASDDDNNSTIVLEVVREWSPNGVDRFYKLIQDNYYNCATFFRVVPDFVVQLGIASEPDLTEKWETKIPDDPVLQSNLYGYVSFATSGPDTRTAQIFINTADNSGLDGQGFSPFAKVIKGMDIITTSLYNPTPGDSGGADQTNLANLGNSWVLQEYPDIDLIKSTKFGTEQSPGTGGVAAATPGTGGGGTSTGVAAAAASWGWSRAFLSVFGATMFAVLS